MYPLYGLQGLPSSSGGGALRPAWRDGGGMGRRISHPAPVAPCGWRRAAITRRAGPPGAPPRISIRSVWRRPAPQSRHASRMAIRPLTQPSPTAGRGLFSRRHSRTLSPGGRGLGEGDKSGVHRRCALLSRRSAERGSNMPPVTRGKPRCMGLFRASHGRPAPSPVFRHCEPRAKQSRDNGGAGWIAAAPSS